MIDFTDKNLKFNANNFETSELFNFIEDLIGKNIIIDDFKANIYYRENEPWSTSETGDFEVFNNFSWICYNEKNYKADIEKVEKLLENTFDNIDDIHCYRYNGPSAYSTTGFDIELKFTLIYQLAEK